MLEYILDRSITHIFASTLLVSVVFFILQSWYRRRYFYGWVPNNVKERLVLSGLFVFGGAAAREVIDVYRGQPLIKAFTDHLSWLVGILISLWCIYRLITLKIE